MTWTIASLVLGLIALMGYSLYCQRYNATHTNSRIDFQSGLVTDMLNEHHIVTAVALQELQDTVNTIRKTTDATHLRHLEYVLSKEPAAPKAVGDDEAIFAAVDALMKDFETSQVQEPVVVPVAWNELVPQEPEDPWKNAR